MLALSTWLVISQVGFAARRVSDSADNVKLKMYPRKNTVEVEANGGMIINQSYINSLLLNLGLAYHASEEWGFGLDYSIASNSDKEERSCIENFYNDPNSELADSCGNRDAIDALGANTAASFGPAYVPIREIQNILSVNAVWTPIYGKQLIFMSLMSYFDLFFEMGAGMANSKFYPKMNILRNGNETRGTTKVKSNGTTDAKFGAKPSEEYAYGKDGRPDPEDQHNPLINLGVGYKLHFARMFHLNASIRNMTLLGTESSFENLFVLYVGLGMRF